MTTFRLTAVNEAGYGQTYHWGDTYEVEAGTYEEAEADVLGREGVAPDPYTPAPQPYARIARAWFLDDGTWRLIQS